MKSLFAVVLLMACPSWAHAQTAVPGTLTVDKMLREVMWNNPEVEAALYDMEVSEAMILQEGIIDDPELTYMREEMPGFRWNQAMMQRIELMQMIRFPTKLRKETELAEIRADHAHHQYMERSSEILRKAKMAFFELWFVQQSTVLTLENMRLLQKFSSVAQTKYAVGESMQQDVLKALVELAKTENQLIVLRQKELSAKAMLMAILNRKPADTLGVVALPQEVVFEPSADTLAQLAKRFRPMLLHDSVMIYENQTMLSLAKQQYIPDFKLGIGYMNSPMGDFKGWGVTAGISLPFAPWSLGRNAGKVEEATAAIQRSRANYVASQNMVLSDLRDAYYRVRSSKEQYEMYQSAIIPQAEHSLQASIIAYQTGKTDFLMLIDAYRTLVDLQMEVLMLRMQFEMAVADVERTVGLGNIARLK